MLSSLSLSLWLQTFLTISNNSELTWNHIIDVCIFISWISFLLHEFLALGTQILYLLSFWIMQLHYYGDDFCPQLQIFVPMDGMRLTQQHVKKTPALIVSGFSIFFYICGKLDMSALLWAHSNLFNWNDSETRKYSPFKADNSML